MRTGEEVGRPIVKRNYARSDYEGEVEELRAFGTLDALVTKLRVDSRHDSDASVSHSSMLRGVCAARTFHRAVAINVPAHRHEYFLGYLCQPGGGSANVRPRDDVAASAIILNDKNAQGEEKAFR